MFVNNIEAFETNSSDYKTPFVLGSGDVISVPEGFDPGNGGSSSHVYGYFADEDYFSSAGSGSNSNVSLSESMVKYISIQ